MVPRTRWALAEKFISSIACCRAVGPQGAAESVRRCPWNKPMKRLLLGSRDVSSRSESPVLLPARLAGALGIHLAVCLHLALAHRRRPRNSFPRLFVCGRICTTPNTDADSETKALAYVGKFGTLNTNVVNFFLTNDSATRTLWEINNSTLRPQRYNLGTTGYGYDPAKIRFFVVNA